MYKDFEIIIEPNEEGGFYARIPDMPSIFTGGVTEIEALKNAKAAIKEYLEICKKDRLPIPQSKSGKFNVRVPKDLHRDLARKAAEQGVSLNQLVVYLLGRGTGKAA
ncbi:MAG: type II toxin-antitoxin system HicB family antitoxin [Thermodesulfovibrionales bacterium]|nr:type II toxin-antitoxin system HicB family antitoxin [Thermodesulfovibrionales bacterium]